MRKFYFLLLSAGACNSAFAQQNLSPSVMAAGGGVSKFNDIELEWTLGEFFTGTSGSYNNMYTAGFQQPLLNNQLLKQGKLNLGTVSIFPNPVHDVININFGLNKSETIKIVLTDVYGKTLLQKNITIKTNTAKIPIQQFASGNYFMTLYNIEGNVTNVFKIIKLN